MRLKDPRFSLGMLIALVCIWWVFRGVELSELIRVLRESRWWMIVLLAAPLQLLSVILRGLRWRHLITSLTEVSRPAAIRATLVGFMVNNIFPLRAGEFIRAWYLAREVEARTASVLGTVVLERVIDALVFVLLILTVIGAHGTVGEGQISPRQAILGTSVIALVLIGGVASLRFAPDLTIRVAQFFVRPLPEKYRALLERLLRQLADGFASLRGGPHLFWIAFHSVMIWLVTATLPFAVTILAVGIQLDGTDQLILASYTSLAWVGVMIAVPNAPGFVGTYQAGCVIALSSFGVSKSMGLAMGWLTWASFWIPVTAGGLLVLFLRKTSLAELDAVIEERL